jgi:hypothetical protein
VITSIQGIEQQRTPDEIYNWVFNLLEQVKTQEQISEIRLRTLPETKVFMEESYPLAIFVKNYFSTDSSVKLEQKVGNQPYDVKVFENSNFDFIEITQAINGEEEYLRNRQLNQTGSVAATGPMIKTGTKANKTLKTEFPLVAVSHEGEKENKKQLIQQAIQSKFSKQYPDKTILLVAFDDSIFSEADDINELKLFLNEHIIPLNTKFNNIFLVGIQKQILVSTLTPHNLY